MDLLKALTTSFLDQFVSRRHAHTANIAYYPPNQGILFSLCLSVCLSVCPSVRADVRGVMEILVRLTCAYGEDILMGIFNGEAP